MGSVDPIWMAYYLFAERLYLKTWRLQLTAHETSSSVWLLQCLNSWHVIAHVCLASFIPMWNYILGSFVSLTSYMGIIMWVLFTQWIIMWICKKTCSIYLSTKTFWQFTTPNIVSCNLISNLSTSTLGKTFTQNPWKWRLIFQMLDISPVFLVEKTSQLL